MPFEVVRLPLLTETGELVKGAPTNITANVNAGTIQIFFGSTCHVVNLRTVVAAEIGEEKEVAAIGKTLGRMALSGVGSALFSKGRAGGVGAGLLDLSIRGMETKSVISGFVAFKDSSILKFSLPGKVFQQILQVIPEHSFSRDAIIEARQHIELIGRMKKDGRRVLDELLQEITMLSRQVVDLRTKAEEGTIFLVRDQARQDADNIAMQLDSQKTLFKVLLFENDLSFWDFYSSSFSNDKEAAVLLGIAVLPEPKREQSRQDPPPPPASPALKAVPDLAATKAE